MDPQMDPSAIPVAVYDEDPEESFIGPEGLTNFFNEEYEAAERFNGDYEDDDEYYDGDGYQQPDLLETSASQRAGTNDAAQAETVSGHTHTHNSSTRVWSWRHTKVGSTRACLQPQQS